MRNIGFPKKPGGAPPCQGEVMVDGNGFQLRQGVAKKYVCLFRTHPEMMRGQG